MIIIKTKTHDLSKILSQEEMKNYMSIEVPKHNITMAIKRKNTGSIRELADLAGMKHPQVVRVTNGSNYNIETLLKILHALDLEIVIKPKYNKG